MSITQTVANDAAAHAVLRAARDSAYRFPEGFAGFSATVEYIDESGSTTGNVSIFGSRAMELAIEADETQAAWIRQELGSLAGYRWPSTYEESDGRYALAFGDSVDPNLGTLLVFGDDPFASSYRIKDNRISQVNRQMGPVRFSINIQRHVPAKGDSFLPGEFTVFTWSLADDRLTQSDAYTDRYVEVDGVFLPSYRRIVTAKDNGISARQISLRDHKLLKGSKA
jgi:hypothetical protein